MICPKCNISAKYYDSVPRIVRSKNRITKWVTVKRFRCPVCGGIHRELPDYILPNKQYEKDIIAGVLKGYITPSTYGYEDYPCEMTMKRWKSSQSLHTIL